MNVPMFLRPGVPIMVSGCSRRWAANTAASLAAVLGASSEASYPRLKANCKNCGAPWEPIRCSYCLTVW